ncbi:MAG: multiple antibiotic resistance protein [Methanolobus sp.]|jgi:multiple antibiotic resistance protein|uniref:MarC family protein n=1 Tax=Methanolobus sp. TaxID=1874737 RepID=UPI00258A3704|nr:NAAT family transporter [Methanolobus sp.]MDK2830509.1 multiple antibiotic resistance protein [Methanolobus sp.]
MDNIAFLIYSFSTLFAIVSPVGGVITFVSLTSDITLEEKNILATKSVILACTIALFFAVTGKMILNFFGVSIDSLRVAGGILLFVVAFDMILAKVSRESITEKEIDKSMDRSDVWIFPIALPLLTGPGTITTIIVLMGSALSIFQNAIVMIAIILTFAITWVFFHFSRRIYKLLGYTGMLVFTRLMGLLLAAMAVNFVAIGIWNIYMSFQ